MIRLTLPERVAGSDEIYLDPGAVEAVEASRVGSRVTCRSGTAYAVMQRPDDVRSAVEDCLRRRRAAEAGGAP